MKSLESKLAVLAFVSLVAGWIAGTTRSQAEIKPHLKTALPEAERFLHLGDDAYAGIKGKAEKTEDVGYVAVGEASGYGGPLRIAVGLDLDGRLVGISVIEHRESAPYYMKIQRRGFPESFVGKNHSDPFSPGEDIDTVSGASSTLQGLADAARKAIRKIASRESTLSLPPEKRTPQRFGFPEITLLLLFGMGLWMYRTKTEKKSIARWGLLIAGFVLIGFLYTIPFSLTHVHALLLGYWPPWITHLFWYILVAGVFLSVILMGKSPYCDGFCPFRATQEILALIGAPGSVCRHTSQDSCGGSRGFWRGEPFSWPWHCVIPQSQAMRCSRRFLTSSGRNSSSPFWPSCFSCLSSSKGLGATFCVPSGPSWII